MKLAIGLEFYAGLATCKSTSWTYCTATELNEAIALESPLSRFSTLQDQKLLDSRNAAFVFEWYGAYAILKGGLEGCAFDTAKK